MINAIWVSLTLMKHANTDWYQCLFGTDVRARVVFVKEENHLSDLVMLCQLVSLDIQSFEFTCTTMVNNINFIQF